MLDESAKPYRAAVYEIVQKIIARSLSPQEKGELKEALFAYVEVEVGRSKEKDEMYLRLKEKCREVGRALWNISKKRGVPTDHLKFLEEFLESSPS